MPTRQDQETPLHAAIVRAIVESTPDHWNSILLVLEREPGNNEVGKFVHELSSPEGHPPVGPEMGVFDATYKLDELLQSYGALLSRAEYRAQRTGDRWSWKSKFEYAKQAP